MFFSGNIYLSFDISIDFYSACEEVSKLFRGGFFCKFIGDFIANQITDCCCIRITLFDIVLIAFVADFLAW